MPFRNVRLFPWASPYRCPCCGYLTLSERGASETCNVCWWEDDGQDDHDADVVRGGPNKQLSLSAARQNFRRLGAISEDGVPYVRRPLRNEDPIVGRTRMDWPGSDVPRVLRAKAVHPARGENGRLGRVVRHWTSRERFAVGNRYPRFIVIAWSLFDWREHPIDELEPADEPEDWLYYWTGPGPSVQTQPD